MLLMNSISNPDGSACVDLPAPSDLSSESTCRLATLDVGVLEDLRRLERRIGKCVLPGMFDVLRRHLPRGCAQLWRALDENDAVTMRQISHRLKSSARCLGLSRLGEICARLEKNAKEGRLQDAKSLLQAVEAEYDRGAEALRRFLASGQGVPA